MWLTMQGSGCVNCHGESLDYTMPHWQMSDDNLNDLLEFLKTLE